ISLVFTIWITWKVILAEGVEELSRKSSQNLPILMSIYIQPLVILHNFYLDLLSIIRVPNAIYDLFLVLGIVLAGYYRSRLEPLNIVGLRRIGNNIICPEGAREECTMIVCYFWKTMTNGFSRNA
ncbi:hypothetical protein ACJX0J_007878, partial [Zea mays]